MKFLTNMRLIGSALAGCVMRGGPRDEVLPPKINPHLPEIMPSPSSIRQEALTRFMRAEPPVSIQEEIVKKANMKRIRKALKKAGVTPQEHAAWLDQKRHEAIAS